MGKITLLCLLFLLSYANIFDSKCLPCHRRKKANLKVIFFNYLLYHSSERRVKKAMREFLLHPDPKKSLFVKDGSIYRHRIDPQILDQALKIYWERYKVIGKIK